MSETTTETPAATEPASPRQDRIFAAMESLHATAQMIAWIYPMSMQPIIDEIVALKALIPQALAEARREGEDYARQTVGDWLEPEARR